MTRLNSTSLLLHSAKGDFFSYNGYKRAIGSHCTKRPRKRAGNKPQEGQRKVNKRKLSHVPTSWNPAVCSSDQESKGGALKQLDRWRENNFYTSDLQLTWAWKVSISLSLFSAASCFSLTFISSSSLAIISSSCLLTCRRGFT